MKRPSPEVKAAVIADYIAGMSTTTAAQKWSVSPSSAHKWILAAGVSRGHKGARENAKRRREAEYALPDGEWVPNSRGVQVWRAA